MKYLIFAELSRNHFLFLIYFILSIIKEIVNHYIVSSNDAIHTFNKCYMCTLSDLLSIIPLTIIKMRSKDILKKTRESKKKETTELTSDINYIYTTFEQRNEKRAKRIIKLSILVSFLEFWALYINITYNIIILIHKIQIKKQILTCDISFNVISKFAFSSWILHTRIYKHHYLSLVINIMALVGFLIYDIITLPEPKSIIYGLKRLVSLILYSLEDVYSKILLFFDSISPYTFLFYRGLFLNFLSLLYSIVFIFVEIPDEKGNFSCVFSRFGKVYEEKINIILYILFFIINYFYNQNVLLIIDKFSPIHFAVATALETFGSLLMSIWFGIKGNLTEFFIKLAVYFILILAALVYNEFIILNFCGFQKYTEQNLRRNSNTELELTIFNENEFFPDDAEDKNESNPEDDNNKNEMTTEVENNKNENIINNESAEPKVNNVSNQIVNFI